MSGAGGPFPPPLDTLTGRWVVEAAESVETTEVRGRSMVKWALRLRHVDSGVTDDLPCFARPSTTYRVGQEVEGYVDRNWEGLVFRRGEPRVGRRR